jgi:membrane-associated phospholipid phosphatase
MKQILVLLLTLVIGLNAGAQNIDIDMLKKLNLERNKYYDPSITFITNSVTPLSIAIPAGFVVNALIKKDSTSRSNAILLYSSIFIEGVLAGGLKYTINRPRPFITYPYIDKESDGGSPSFPSGHTSNAFALATSLSITCPKWYVIAPSLLWASAVGYSRMDLGVHYPSDVLAGAIIGSGSAYLAYKLNSWITKKFDNRPFRKKTNIDSL